MLWSVRARKMMTVVEDTCGGHDTIFGCCSFELDDVRYGARNPRACQQNFESELARHGLGPAAVVPNINFFMRVPVERRRERRDRRRMVQARGPRRPARGDGRPRRHLELPGGPQPRDRRRRTNPDPRHPLPPLNPCGPETLKRQASIVLDDGCEYRSVGESFRPVLDILGSDGRNRGAIPTNKQENRSWRLNELVGCIELLQERIRSHHDALRENETRTRMALIDPLLRALGWDVFRPGGGDPGVQSRRRMGRLRPAPRRWRPAAVVEAKKLGEGLSSHRMQMLNYAESRPVSTTPG